MIVLDTNVVSEFMRERPAQGVIGWLGQQTAHELAITAITGAELLYGVARLAEGRRQARLAQAVGALIEEDFSGRVLAFDVTAAGHYARVVADRVSSGRPIEIADAQIASICRSYDAPLATRNTRDFIDTGVIIIDPWEFR